MSLFTDDEKKELVGAITACATKFIDIISIKFAHDVKKNEEVHVTNDSEIMRNHAKFVEDRIGPTQVYRSEWISRTESEKVNADAQFWPVNAADKEEWLDCIVDHAEEVKKIDDLVVDYIKPKALGPRNVVPTDEAAADVSDDSNNDSDDDDARMADIFMGIAREKKQEEDIPESLKNNPLFKIVSNKGTDGKWKRDRDAYYDHLDNTARDDPDRKRAAALMRAIDDEL